MDAIESNVEAAFAEHGSGGANVLEVSSSVRRHTVESISPLVIPPLDLTKPKATQLSGGESGVQEGLPVGESNASLADGRKQRMFGQQSLRRLSVKPVSMFGLATRASRDKDELQAKTATYEMMMQHFQVRKVNRTHVSGSDFIPTDFTDPMRRTIVRQSSLRQEGDMESMTPARAHSSSDLNGYMNSGRGLAFRRTRSVQGESSDSEDPIVSPTTKEDVATGESRRRSSVSNVSAHDHERRPSLSMNEGERNVDSAKLLVRRTTSDDFSTLAPPRSRRSTGVPSHATAREAEMQSKVGLPYSQKCSRRFAWRWWKAAMKRFSSPISPDSNLAKSRWLLLGITFLAQLVFLPLVPVYFGHDTHPVLELNATFECIFFIDILCTLNTSYFDKASRTLVASRRQIALRYLRGWFVLDAISAIPVDTVRLLFRYADEDGNYEQEDQRHVVFHIILRLPRLLQSFKMMDQLLWLSRVLRLWKELFTWLMYSRYSHLMRIVWLVLLVILTSHYMACCWHWITGDNTNAPNAVGVGAPAWEQYLSDMYYCTLLLQGQGEYKGTTPLQNLFSTFSVLLGSVILAIVFGNVAMLVSNFNANSTNYQRKMEVVFATMNKLQLPHDLRERIHLYYDHLWQEYESLDGDIVKFSKELTHTLALEVGLYRYMNLIMKVPYWRECSPDFVTQVVLNLVARVYLPDDYVVRQGEIGEEMYMVNRGLCEFADVARMEDFTSIGGRRDSIGRKGSGLDSSDDAATGLDRSQQPQLTRVGSQRLRRGHSNGTLKSSKSSSDIEGSMTEGDEVSTVRPSLGGAFSPHPSVPVVGKQIVSGETFGEMALLMNYRSMTGVRAVTYVEMCVLDRTKFQQILARYPDDRRRVLRLMLSACVEKREIPFSRGEICQMVARKRQVPILSVLDESDGVGGEELVEVLLDRMDQPLVDQSIMFGYHSRSEARMTGSFRMTPRSLRRKRSGRTLSGSSNALAAVLELDQTSVGADGAAIESVSSSPSSINPLPSTMQSEYQRGLETQLERISSRVQEMERHQSQSMELLRRIASQLGGSGSDMGASVKVRSSDPSNVDTTPPVDSSSAAQSKAERKRLQRRSSLGPAVHHISSAYATTSTSPRSAIVAATRLADELWQNQSVAKENAENTPIQPRSVRRTGSTRVGIEKIVE